MSSQLLVGILGSLFVVGLVVKLYIIDQVIRCPDNKILAVYKFDNFMPSKIIFSGRAFVNLFSECYMIHDMGKIEGTIPSESSVGILSRDRKDIPVDGFFQGSITSDREKLLSDKRYIGFMQCRAELRNFLVKSVISVTLREVIAKKNSIDLKSDEVNREVLEVAKERVWDSYGVNIDDLKLSIQPIESTA